MIGDLGLGLALALANGKGGEGGACAVACVGRDLYVTPEDALLGQERGFRCEGDEVEDF